MQVQVQVWSNISENGYICKKKDKWIKTCHNVPMTNQVSYRHVSLVLVPMTISNMGPPIFVQKIALQVLGVCEMW